MSAPAGVVDVRLVQVPVPLWARAQEHSDELFREFALVAADAQAHPDDTSVPARLLRLIDRLQRDYADTADAAREQLFAAAAAGQQVLPVLRYAVPPAVAGASEELGRLLDEADDYCRTGTHLLTLATPADLVAFRRWYLGEFVRQVAGEPPLSWPEFRAAAPAAGGA